MAELSDTADVTLAAGVANTIDIPCNTFGRASLLIKNAGANTIGTLTVGESPNGTLFGTLTPIGTAIGSLAAGASKMVQLDGLTCKTLRVTGTSTSGSTMTVEYALDKSSAVAFQARVDGVRVDLPVAGSVSSAIDDATTNGVTDIATLTHTTTGTATAGIGAGLLLAVENGAGTTKSAVDIAGILTTVTDAAEVSAFVVKTRTGGGAMTEALRASGAGVCTSAAGFVATTGGLTGSAACAVEATGALSIGAAASTTSSLIGRIGNVTTMVGDLLLNNLIRAVLVDAGVAGSSGTASASAGTFTVSSGTTTYVLTNTKISSTSLLFCTCVSGAVGRQVNSFIPTSSTGTLLLSGAAAADAKYAFLVINA